MTEKQIQANITKFLTLKNIVYSVTDVGLMRDARGIYKYKRGTAGFPDISCILPPDGQYVGIEVKQAKGKTSPIQREMHERIAKVGGIVLIARSVADVADFLETYNK